MVINSLAVLQEELKRLQTWIGPNKVSPFIYEDEVKNLERDLSYQSSYRSVLRKSFYQLHEHLKTQSHVAQLCFKSDIIYWLIAVVKVK